MTFLSSLLRTSVGVSVFLLGTYITILVLLCLPATQRMGMFLNFVNYPFGVDWELPEQFGFAHNKINNFNLETPDGLLLGVWHVLPTSYYSNLSLRHQPSGSIKQHVYDAALSDPKYDTIIYFHGNAGNRASPWRIDSYKKFSDKFDVNIIAIDYRGFGNSQGSPSEEGLRIDAKATWDWVRSKGVSSNKIIIVGHSLGTGVASQLAADVSLAGTSPKALFLKSAYSSISEVLFEYTFLKGYIPLLYPLRPFPQAQKFILSYLQHFFDSMSIIETVNCPVVLFDGARDFEIPGVNSRRLFHRAINGGTVALLDDYLETDKRITKKVIENEGIRYDFAREGGALTLVELLWAHHNNVPQFEMVWDVISEVLRERT